MTTAKIGSMSGIVVDKPHAQCFYTASKAVIYQLTRSLAAEWAMEERA